MTANKAATSPFQFGQDFPSAPTRVIFMSRGELKVIIADPHNQKEKGLVPVLTFRGEIMWVHADIGKPTVDDCHK